MNGNVPIIGQQEVMQQQVIQNIIIGVFTGLVPVVAAARLTRGYPDPETGIDDPATPERIAVEAGDIAQAALKVIGIKWNRSG